MKDKYIKLSDVKRLFDKRVNFHCDRADTIETCWRCGGNDFECISNLEVINLYHDIKKLKGVNNGKNS